MAPQSQTELARFSQFISETLHAGRSELTPEEALDLWRTDHPDPDDFDEAVADLRESFADIAEGDRGVSLEEFDGDFRRQHHLDVPPG